MVDRNGFFLIFQPSLKVSITQLMNGRYQRRSGKKDNHQE